MSSAEEHNDALAHLIERLLADASFRSAFRRDPATVCHQFGLHDLAEELRSGGKATETLELRESKSSLAGAVLALAAEGMGALELSGLIQHAGLRGAPGMRALHAAKHPVRAAGTNLGAPASVERQAGAAGAAGAGAQAPGAQPPGEIAAAAPAGAAPGSPVAGAGTGAAGATPAGAPPAASGGVLSQVPGGGVAGAASPVPGEVPGAAVSGAAVPGQVVGGGAPAAAAGVPGQVAGGVPGAAGQIPGEVPGGAAPGAALPGQVPGGAPGGAGAVPGPAGWPEGVEVPEGTPGAPPVAEAVAGAIAEAPAQQAAMLSALLENPHVAMPTAVRSLISQGGMDPRAVSLLAGAAANHEIVLGEVSTSTEPVHAQAIEIVSVDGQPIGPQNSGARDLVTEIAALEPGQRPSEIDTPWPIHAQGFFQTPPSADRLRLGFVSQADYQPPSAPGVQGAVAGGPQAEPPASAGRAAAGHSGAAAASNAVAGQAAPPGQAGGHVARSGAAAAIAYAHSMLGKLPESAGPNEGPRLTPFEAEYGFRGAPWCGIFAGHALGAAGLKVPHSVASVASILELARSGEGPFERGILPVSAVRPGDLVTFGGTEHVALVIGVDGQGIHTIAGNYENNVTEHTYPPSEVTGVVRPRYPAEAPGGAAGGPGAQGPEPAQAGMVPGTATAAGGPSPTPASKPQTAVFHAVGAKASADVRHTVKFLPAVPQDAAQQAAYVAQQPGVVGAAAHGAPAQAQFAGEAAGGSLEPIASGPVAYPGDNAPKPKIATWMGEVAARHGLPRELPVMAALVESSLHNDPGGDRDSVGYFQMRTSIWNNGPYAGYPQNPDLQVKWFIDQALQVKRSNPSLADQPSQWGEWIADVERPAEEFRGRYQLQLGAARQLLSER